MISLFIPRTLIIAVQLLQSYFAPCQKLTRFASNALLLLFNVPFLLLYSSALEPKLSEDELNFGRGLKKFGCKGQIGKEREKRIVILTLEQLVLIQIKADLLLIPKETDVSSDLALLDLALFSQPRLYSEKTWSTVENITRVKILLTVQC